MQATSPVDMLTSLSACQTEAATACPGTADESKIVVVYGTTGVANNLLPTSVTAEPGNGVNPSTASQTYDPFGNIQTVTGPLGTSQKTVFLYDAGRQRVGSIGPNPGNSEGLQYPAERITYTPDGIVSETEAGYDTNQSDTTFATFTSSQQQTTTFDGVDRPTKKTLTASGTTYNVTQFSYDNADRLTCSAVRMNPAVFATLPSSACVLGIAGSYGPDRIAAVAYSNADQLTKVTVASGTAHPADYLTYTYTNNGLVQTVLDADTNLTTETYDGFDRLSEMEYPVKLQGGNASDSTNYELLGYDADDNLTSVRTRSGDSVTLLYDALNRPTQRTVPTWSGQNVFYAFDLLNRVTSATFGSLSGSGVKFTYDAVGRKTSETTQGLTVGSMYDAAGDRTQLTWPDGVYVNYVYDYLQRPIKVELEGATSGLGLLGVYTYDNLRRMTGVTRGNTASTNYGYDGVSRLSSLSQSYSNTSTNVTWNYTYDPSNNIVVRTTTNDAYTYHPSPVSRTYVTNGLNQYSTVSGVIYSYDGRGNLTSDTSRSFTYDVDNELLTGSAPSQALTQTFDPLRRKLTFTLNGAAETYLYDGADFVADYVSGAVSQRDVPSGFDDGAPIVIYSGAGMTVPSWYHGNEQDSRINVSDTAGSNEGGTYGYDPYGEPSIWGPYFRYTTQFGISGLDLYYDHLRDYDPNLGRFMQTDPVGLGAGLNLYAYVDDDPINATDPSGAVLVCGPEGPEHIHTTPDGEVTVTGGARDCRDVEGAELQALLGGGAGGGIGGGGGGGGTGNNSPPAGPKKTVCHASENGASNGIEAVGKVHDSIIGGFGTSLRSSGALQTAAQLDEVAGKLGPALSIVAGGVAVGLDVSQGRNLGRSVLVHGLGAAGGIGGSAAGLAGGAVAGGAVFPPGGEVVGAIYGGIILGVGGQIAGEGTGTVIANALGLGC